MVRNAHTTFSTPQTCDNCERTGWGDTPVPPYGDRSLNQWDTAGAKLKAGLDGAHIPTNPLDYQYYEIPYAKVRDYVDEKLCVIATKIPPPPAPEATPPSPAGALYFAIQFEGLSKTVIKPLDNSNCQRATLSAVKGRMIRVPIDVDGDDRVLVIWLRDDRQIGIQTAACHCARRGSR